MIILGIDPGSRITGFGLINTDGFRHQYVASGAIKTDGDHLAARLHQIFTGLDDVIVQYRPTEAGIEEVFMNKNANSAIKLGQARGAALVAVAGHELPVGEYAPRKIKQSVVGYGNAEKQQIQHMVKLLLNLDKQPSSDAADALAIAICHANLRQCVMGRR